MDFERAALRSLAHIANSTSIHPENKELIQAYCRHMRLSDISGAQRQKLMSHLKILAEHVGMQRFEDMETADIVSLVEWLYSRGTSESTVTDYKQAIKQFWKWMHNGEDPVETKWIRRSRQSYHRLLAYSLLTPDDIQAMIAACVNERDRAFIAILWETGARIGELIDLKVGDIEPSPIGKHVVVSGKTGSRRLLLIESGPYIDRWLAVHPRRRADSFLWCKIDEKQGSPDEQIGYNYIRLRLLERARVRAEIEKPVNPHHFRHSRATYLANHLTEAQMCEWLGWTRGSKVPGRYVHLSGRDIDRAYLAMLTEPEYQRLSGAIAG